MCVKQSSSIKRTAVLDMLEGGGAYTAITAGMASCSECIWGYIRERIGAGGAGHTPNWGIVASISRFPPTVYRADNARPEEVSDL